MLYVTSTNLEESTKILVKQNMRGYQSPAEW